jgi:hypothetical protein
MRAIRLSALRDLLRDGPFEAWWAEYVAAVSAEREAVARHAACAQALRLAEVTGDAGQREAMDAFSQAGEAEDDAARAAAEAQAHENHALTQVASFEEQRFRTSDLWYRLGAAERAVELRRDELAGASRADGDKARAQRTQAEAALHLAERQVAALRDEYATEDRKRSQLWDDVEAAWGRSFERALVGAEHVDRARAVRREAERRFREAEEQRLGARLQRDEAAAADRGLAEAVRRRGNLRANAAERFGCSAGEAFLYWRHQDDQRAAWAVALQEDATRWNQPVKALEIFTVGRARGVALLEPAREGLPLSLDHGDRRFDDYFLGPRRTAPREGAAPAEPEAEER